ncbi:hypothetical protein JJB07_03375 [Tumebacillus sp. ITR2]|uniref:Restriction endonuclease n=1 Tax=Tumebacillus amylolyticus TaxID=2801339 RepID=A0ABS1J5X3_9BACL|nr:hypothetical protein [Tumebacillus amylolyticus]MBL0385682.1 hypothetical protein [Tumebacillus amylolyticus]
MKKETVELKEYETSQVLPHKLLTDDDRLFLKELTRYKDKHRFYFEELKRGFQIRAQSWVGVIELSNLRIQITPKFDRGFSRLVEMLCFLDDIPHHNWRDTSGELDKSDFVELLARMFLQELKKVIQSGIVKEYVTLEDNLNQMRGRPDFLINMRMNYATPTRMYCHFDELITDIPENQVLRTALEVLQRLPIQSSTKKRVRRLLGEFEDFCESYLELGWPHFQYNRLNAHYETSHDLAYYIIHQTFLKDMYKARDQTYFSLLMDMNDLFERFSAKLLQTYLPKPTYRVKPDKSFSHAIRSGEDCYRSIKPDIIVQNRSDQTNLVLDVKYKNYGPNRINNDDIYQLSFYAHSFHRDTSKPCSVHLIYPKYADEQAPEENLSLLPGTPHALHLHTKPLSIETTLDLIKSKRTQDLTNLATSLISGH